jgi:hypothetical protein
LCQWPGHIDETDALAYSSDGRPSPNSYSHADTNTNSYSHADADSCSHASPDSDPNADPDSYPCPGPHPGASAAGPYFHFTFNTDGCAGGIVRVHRYSVRSVQQCFCRSHHVVFGRQPGNWRRRNRRQHNTERH